MSHGVDERCSQLLALPRGLNLPRKILCSCPFQANCHEVRDPLQNGIRHPRALNRQACDRFRAQTHSALVYSPDWIV